MKTFFKQGLPFILLLTCAIMLFGCGSSNSNTSERTPPKTNENKPTENKPTETTASTNSNKIGVPECDDYIAKYEACVDSKVPEAQRAQMKAAFDASRKAWKEAAATEQGKATLATACKQAHDAAKQSMASYGCAW